MRTFSSPLDIGAVLADRGEDIACDPLLKGTGLRLVAPHDELVEAAFGDEDVGRRPHSLEQIETVAPSDRALLVGAEVLEVADGASVRQGQDQRRAGVRRDEPRDILQGDAGRGDRAWSVVFMPTLADQAEYNLLFVTLQGVPPF